MSINIAPKQIISARVVQGHRVASGRNGDSRFPGGTIRMQVPHFQVRGFDISHLFLGTLNVSITPLYYRVAKAKYTFRGVKWHPTQPAEDFSFFDVEVHRYGQPSIPGFIYYPHPETKPDHFQQPDVLELLLPFVNGLCYGTQVRLEIPKAQMIVESPDVYGMEKSLTSREA